ncbi:hypothetical protein CkaCkLH20_11022 [Colletotrichum karsti]|uniref:Secreted protein n=1 Tax=Colletotrichum karsti TaxID=1095194 RepID=A0A9P6I3Q3_9PEZI|nr:uncharacterized protein CkaCkLH20_11022 [Colletotrichum karsti]KAF9871375.1 hypothetical protein CkaCkLH20_11022 [Colletotrichum karsti]
MTNPNMQTKLIISFLAILGFREAFATTVPNQVSKTSQLFDALPEWNIKTSPGGPVVSFNGTVEALFAYMDSEYPEHLSDVFDLDVVFGSGERGQKLDTPMLEKRTDFSESDAVCYSGAVADGRAITDGIEYLRGVRGQPSLPVDGSYLVSCSQNSGIKWHNHSKQQITLESFGSIADGAQHIVKFCRKEDKVGGVVFHHTQWGVEIRKATC